MSLVHPYAASMAHCQATDAQPDAQTFYVAQQQSRYHSSTQPQRRAPAHSTAPDARRLGVFFGLTPLHPDQKQKTKLVRANRGDIGPTKLLI